MESERGKASFHSPNWGSLPQELQTAILVRLPVKYLLRFKSVSKYSLRLISSPQFVKAHLHVSSKDYRLLLCNYRGRNNVRHCSVTSLFDDLYTDPFDLTPAVDKRYKYSRILGSVNGLICFNNSGSKGGFYLWNPSTRKKKIVPLPTDDSCYRFYGFGYDETQDDYKMVGISNSDPPLCSKIYSLRSDSWRELNFRGKVSFCDSAKLVNGKLHWATGSSASDDRGIISFDLVDEKFGKVVLPCYKAVKKELSLGVLGSDLSMLCNYKRRAGEVTQSDLWVMKKYGVEESWMKLYTIKYPGTYPHNWRQSPLCMSSKGAILFVNGTALRIYNPEDKSFKPVVKVSDHPSIKLDAGLYIESLVCPLFQNEAMAQH